MNATGIKVLKLLIKGQMEQSELLEILKVKDRGLAYILESLSESGYIDKKNATIRLGRTPKTELLRDVSRIVDIERLLNGSNETIFSSIGKGSTMKELARRTRLSKATMHRSVSELQSAGAIVKKGDVIRINDERGSLSLFASMLSMEKNTRYDSTGIEIIFDDGSTVLRKTPVGTTVAGASTGFSLFSEYGIEYRTINDYFCEQKEDINMEDVLLHAMYSSIRSEDKAGLLICIIFYVKHKEKMDILQLRKKSAKFGILDVWLDVESYIRQNIPGTKLILPWNEFLAKAELYGIPAENYTLPRPSEIFKRIDGMLERPLVVYLIGGENMRMKSLKDSTKDCDIVVEDRDSFDRIVSVLYSMGYEQIGKNKFLNEDQRIDPSGIFIHENESRIDLFTHKIVRKLALSKGMIKRADSKDYGKLEVRMLRNEDVFLLKAVTGREGDIRDMQSLVVGSENTPGELQHGGFDWKLVWEEILEQEMITKVGDFMYTVLDQLTYLDTQTGITSPFFGMLRSRVIDMTIRSIILGGKLQIKDIVHYLEGYDITETRIRNRIDSMARDGTVEKLRDKRTTSIRLLKDGAYHRAESEITRESLTQYMNWRFRLRGRATDSDMEAFVRELKERGFEKIGEVDGQIGQSIKKLETLDEGRPVDARLDRIEAARICIGMD